MDFLQKVFIIVVFTLYTFSRIFELENGWHKNSPYQNVILWMVIISVLFYIHERDTKLEIIKNC